MSMPATTQRRSERSCLAVHPDSRRREPTPKDKRRVEQQLARAAAASTLGVFARREESLNSPNQDLALDLDDRLDAALADVLQDYAAAGEEDGEAARHVA